MNFFYENIILKIFVLGHFQMVLLLMQHGADPNIKDGEGCSGLHLGKYTRLKNIGLLHDKY